jgi:hypothetical protein
MDSSGVAGKRGLMVVLGAMNTDKKRIVLISVRLPISFDRSSKEVQTLDVPILDTLAQHTLNGYNLERFFSPCDNNDFIAVGPGVFLADENPCFPAILSLIQHCSQRGFPLCIFPLAESSITLSQGHQAVQEWAGKHGLMLRLTGFPPPSNPKIP